MAEVHVHYDTVSKVAKAHVDGKEVPNFHSVSFSRRYSEKEGEEPKHYMDLHQREHDEEHDMHRHHHTMAAELPAAGVASATDSPLLDGHRVVTTAAPVTPQDAPAVRSHIAEFFKKGK